MERMRIVSLLPGATETLWALGLGGQVVAVSHECDHPPEALRLPRVTRSNLELAGLDGGAIEVAVQDALAAGRQLYAIDADGIRELQPDLVVTQDVCEVCAVPTSQVERELAGVPVLRLHPHSLEDVLQGMAELGRACGVDPVPMVAELRRRIAKAAAAAPRPPVRGVFLEWLDPPYPAGHWTADLLRLAGVDDPLARPGRPSAPVGWDEVVAARPEVLIVAPCGFGEEQARSEVERLRGEIARTGARRLLVFDGSVHFNRPGPRLVDSLEALVAGLTE